MSTLYNYLKTPSYKFVVRSLLEIFQEDYDKIVRQFIMYGINEISPIERIMPQDYTPGFASLPNHEVYVFTIDLQTPLAAVVIYDTICETLDHSFASIIVHGYNEPIESAYRSKAVIDALDREAEADGLRPASIYNVDYESDLYSPEFVQAIAGEAGVNASVASALSASDNWKPDLANANNPLMAAATAVQNELQKNKAAVMDYKTMQKYSPPRRTNDDFDTKRWYQDFESKLVQKVATSKDIKM